MAGFNSKQLWQERHRLSDEQHRLMSDGRTEDALVLEGQIKQLDLTLEYVLDAEDAMRSLPTTPAQPLTLGVRALGPRDEFRPLEVGYKNEVVTVTSPTEIELTLPAKLPSLFNNFASTLAETPAVGSISFKQRSTQTGSPDTWGGVTDGESATKEEVIYTWTDATANKETIAGYVPVSKDTLADYDELMSIIENDLLLDLNEVTDARFLTGSNTAGITGILNLDGIQSYTAGVGGNYYEAILLMRLQVMENARRVPNCVCMSPEIKAAIDLYKTETGYYQTLGSTTYWGMQVIEDVNCPGLLVYDSTAALRRSIHGLTVEVGYYNDQFIKNELSILAEHTKALQVRYPDAFCYATQETLDVDSTTTTE